MMQFQKGKDIKIWLITDYLLKNNLSKSAFCKLCKISPTTLKKVMSGELEFSVVSLFKISSTLNVRMSDMFE